MLGTIVNTAAILLGTLLGLLLKKGLPERFQDVIMKGLALCVLLIGISGALKGENTLIAILSIAIGAIIGEIIDLDRRLNNLGQLLEARFSKGDGDRPLHVHLSRPACCSVSVPWQLSARCKAV